MRTYLPLLLLGALPAQAQGLPPSPAPAAAIAAAVPDTVAALHRLFAQRRARMRRAFLATLVVGGGLTTLVATDNPPTNDPVYAGLEGFAAIILGTGTTAVATSEVITFFRYTRRDERRALAQWQAHQLPPRLRQQLAPRYFEPAKRQ